MSSIKKVSNYLLPLSVLLLVMSSCQKMERPKLGDYPKDTNPPGGPLKFFTAFDGSDVDSIRGTFASSNPLKFTQGVNKQALQGERGKAIRYPSANDFKNSTSFTLSWWMKQKPHKDGAEFLFSLTDKDYWHNSAMFMLIEDEGQSTSSEAAMKFVLQDQWFEFVGPNKMRGNILNDQWHHLAIVYDQTTSKLTWYVDGNALTGLPANLTDVKKDGNPRGPLTLRNAGNLIISGWGKHVGLEGPGDPWVQSYSGALDQWRMYGRALTPTEVMALYNSKQ